MAKSIDLSQIADNIHNSGKYISLSKDTIMRIVLDSSRRFSKSKDIEDASRKKLHQIYAAYLIKSNKDIFKLIDNFNIEPFNSNNFKLLCLEVLGTHNSTKERLNFIGDFYIKIKEKVSNLHRVIDLGCGLNPFSYPWIQSAFGDIEYIGYDINKEATTKIDSLFQNLNLPVHLYYNDLFDSIPEHTESDVVMLLKILPCLEQQEKGISEKILNSIKSKTFIISFPSLSLGGKQKGMKENYNNFIDSILTPNTVEYSFIDFFNERIYIFNRIQ